MKTAIILGNGPSARKYVKQDGHHVFGCNDAWAIGLPVDTICITDSYRRIKDSRPLTLKTPSHIRKVVGGNADWVPALMDNATFIHTFAEARAWHFGQSGLHTAGAMKGKPKFSHGYLTPMFASMVALSEGYRHLEVWGVDLSSEQYSDGARKKAAMQFAEIAELCECLGGSLIFSEHSHIYQFMAKKKETLPMQAPAPEAPDVETIRVPAGIGDGLWVAMLLDTSKKYDVRICGGIPYRAHQLWELLPFVAHVSYDDKQRYPLDCTHEENSRLEKGERIDAHKPANWELPLHNPAIAPPFQHEEGTVYIGVYESSKNHAWRKEVPTWSHKTWLTYLDLIAQNVFRAGHDKVKFVLFGAEYDDFFTPDFLGRVPFGAIDCRGASLAETISGIMQCKGFIGFPSGIPILANYLGIPTIMPCHPQKHRLLENAFCRPGKHTAYSIAGGWKCASWGDHVSGLRNWTEWITKSKWPYL